MTDPKLPRPLVRALAYGHLVVVVGPGVSPVRDLDHLKHELAQDLGDVPEEELREADVLDVAEWHEHRLGRAALIARVQALSSSERDSGKVYQHLAELRLRELITSQQDAALERAFERAGREVAPLVPDRGMRFDAPGRLPLLKLHGDFGAPGRLVLTRRDDEEYDRAYPSVRRHLEDLAATSTFLFLGTTLKDAAFRRAFGAVGERLREVGRASYAVVVRPSAYAVEAGRARGLVVLPVEDHAGIAKILRELAAAAGAEREDASATVEELDAAPYEEAWRAAAYKRARYAEAAGLFQFRRTVYRRDVERKEIYVVPRIEREQEERGRGCTACGRPGAVDAERGPVCRTAGCPREGQPVPDLPAYRPPVTLADLLRGGARAVILGSPGVGKTALLLWLEHELALRHAESLGIAAAPLPFFLRLREHARAIEAASAASLEATVVEHLARHLTDAPDAHVRRWLEEGRMAFLLDGFDEVPSGLRERVAGDVQAFLTRYPRCPAILSSRPSGYRAAPLGMPFTVYTIEPLDPPRVADFLRRWLRVIARWDELSEQQADAKATDLVTALEQRSDLGGLVSNPLLLTLLVLVHRVGKRLPERRAEFYEAALRTLGETWESAKGVGPERGYPDAAHLLRTLGRVAYRLHRTQQDREVRGDLLLRWIAASFREDLRLSEAAAERQARAFLKVVEERVGVLAETAPGVFGFVHLGFQEYLTAWHLKETATREERRDVLRRFLHEPRWEEVLRLLISVLPQEEATAMLREILDGGSPYEEVLHRDLLFAGRCLTDDPNVDVGLARRIIDGLFKIGSTNALVLLGQLAGIERWSENDGVLKALLERLQQWSPSTVPVLQSLTRSSIFVKVARHFLLGAPAAHWSQVRIDVAEMCIQRGHDPDQIAPRWFVNAARRFSRNIYSLWSLRRLVSEGYGPAVQLVREKILHARNPVAIAAMFDVYDDVAAQVAREFVRRERRWRGRIDVPWVYLARHDPGYVIDNIGVAAEDDVHMALANCGVSNDELEKKVWRLAEHDTRASVRGGALLALGRVDEIDVSRWFQLVEPLAIVDGDFLWRIMVTCPERVPPTFGLLGAIRAFMTGTVSSVVWLYLAQWHVRDEAIESHARSVVDRDAAAVIFLQSVGGPIERHIEALLQGHSAAPSFAAQEMLINLLANHGRRSPRIRALLADPADRDLRWLAHEALRRCAPIRAPRLTDGGLLFGASIEAAVSAGPGAVHLQAWQSRFAGTPVATLLDRFAAWLRLVVDRPETAPRARHHDFADRPARISLLGEALLRGVGRDQKALSEHLAGAPEDLVAAAYANHLDHAVHVLASDEPMAPEARRALAAVLELPSDRSLLLDQSHRLGADLARSLSAPDALVQAPPWSICAAAIARHTWKISDPAARAILAANSPELTPVVRLSPDDPIPGLFLLCEAVQLWQRPVRIGGEDLVELPEIEVEGLDEGGPDGRFLLGERLVFRLDYRFNDAVLEKTGFDPGLVRRRMRASLGRLRITAEAFPDVVVELRLPDGDERIEVLREAGVPAQGKQRPQSHAKTTPARQGTWEALEPLLMPPSSLEALERLEAVLPMLQPEEAARARRRVRTLLRAGKRAPGVRARAAQILVDRFYDAPDDDERVAIFEALLGYAERKGLGPEEREKALGALIEIYGGLPLEAGERIVAFLSTAAKRGGLPSDLRTRIQGVESRHSRRAGARMSGRTKKR